MYNSLNHHMMRLLDFFYTEHDCNILDSRQKTNKIPLNTNILVLSSIKDILSQQLKLALFHLNGILLYAEMS